MKILLKNRHKHGGEYHPAGSIVDWPDDLAKSLVEKGSATTKLVPLSVPQCDVVDVPSVDLEQKENKKGKK